MPLPPLYSQTLRGLARQTKEDDRLSGIQYIVEDIYYAIIELAKSSCKTSYELPLFEEAAERFGRRITPKPHHTLTPVISDQTKCEFMLENIVAIIAGIQKVFPDSTVKQKILSRGESGTFYDMTNITERMRPYFRERGKPYIVVDW